MLALSRQISVIGSMQDEREDLVDVLALAAAGKVTPRLETYPLAQVNDLMERQAATAGPLPRRPRVRRLTAPSRAREGRRAADDARTEAEVAPPIPCAT